MVRDVALAASGLLSPAIGGPSVFPLQPDGIWDNPYSDDVWKTSEGADRHRRGLYTFIRRTSPYPSFMTFDATSREFCTVRRVRTNTPLQALTGLNDEAFFEAARALAIRVAVPGPSSARRRASEAFRLVTGRHATEARGRRHRRVVQAAAGALPAQAGRGREGDEGLGPVAAGDRAGRVDAGRQCAAESG